MVFSVTDYLWGIEQEKKIRDSLENKFGKLSTTHKTCNYDLFNDEYNIEIKSRRCKYDKYPTTLLCNDKINDIDKKQIFIFNFEDKILYIEFDENLFKTFDVKFFNRKNYPIKKYFYIPIDKLKTI